MGINTPKPYLEFGERVFRHREDLIRLIRALVADGKRVLGYGASTKGNVLLQYCGITSDDISYVGEVNAEKFGCYTPGTFLPIIEERELLAKHKPTLPSSPSNRRTRPLRYPAREFERVPIPAYRLL